MTDDLDDLLAPSTGTPAPAVRDAVLRRTERLLARRRWTRRAARAGAFAAVFAAGGWAGWVVKPAPTVPAPEVRIVPVPVPMPIPAESPGVVAVEAPATAGEWELRAELADDPGDAARGYRAAGDRYLDAGDYPNAARCYRLFLTRAGAAEHAPRPDDSWLLVSVKNLTLREMSDATKRDG